MADIFEELLDLKRRRVSFCMATIVFAGGSTPRKAGARMLVLADGRQKGSIGGGALERQVMQDCISALEQGRCILRSIDMDGEKAVMACGGKVRVFIEPFPPPAVLFILGAGHIGKALFALSAFCGMDAVLIDQSMEALGQAKDARKAGRVVHVANFSSLPEETRILPSDFVVIASGTHEDDLKCVRTALKTEAGFIGLVGSRKKKGTIMDKLRLEGTEEKDLERISCPVGLPIGAQGPEEIAVSIIAQLIRHSRLPEAGINAAA